MSEDLGFQLPPPATPSSGKVLLIAGGFVAVVVGAFVVGYLPRHQARKELVAEAAGENLLRVQVVSPKAKSSDRAMLLPGSVQALEETTLYPRANGYVRAWKADIGDTVKEGAPLAEIEVPEIDQQLAQAQAQLAQAEAALVQAKANRTYADATFNRYKELTPKGVASEQELDKAKSQQAVDSANVEVATANVDAQKANIRRLAQMQGFSHVVAPFTGRITMRWVERGSLVSSTTPLFKISQTDTVRVFLQVPQDVAPGVVIDAPAQVQVREYPGRHFDGKVARATGSLDPTSRTMLTEVRVPNEKHELLSGMYAQVSLTLPSPHRVFEVPASAVMTDAKGVRVAIVEGGKLRLAPVVVERDSGSVMEIASGVGEGDKVVRLASADLVDGRSVEVVEAAPAASPGK